MRTEALSGRRRAGCPQTTFRAPTGHDSDTDPDADTDTDILSRDRSPRAVRLRNATGNDLEAMTALLAELFSLEPDFPICPEAQERGLRLLLGAARRGVACLKVATAVDTGQVVGMATVQIVISTAEGAPAGWVEDVVVTAPWRGRGVGSRLLDAVATWAGRKGVTRLQLLADRGNRAALAFYAGRGWQRLRLAPLRLRR